MANLLLGFPAMVTTYQAQSSLPQETPRWNWACPHLSCEQLVAVRPVVHFGRGLRVRRKGRSSDLPVSGLISIHTTPPSVV